ncbi:GNAT family N-acetyltransferase [Nonomuraea deserti]|uniref:GNAT family N-acetyltransferase n=2 Tax=Nonomuraea deserti TaxID=1848322 RepID=A0A4R4V152_9ACTN|nr:GNAT family N-acetyltransferase [Nonomuraea deserti]
MGVIRGRQGTGLGSAMLRHRLGRADADGLPAYLEASSPRSRALYERHGFEELGEPVRVADSPLLWPMWRRPHR